MVSDTPIRLNLGCYNKKLHGFINIDIRPEVQPDVVDDICRLEKCESLKGQISLVYCCHGIEHLTYKQVGAALKRYHELLRPGGELRLSLPDMEAAFAAYYYHNRNLSLIRSMLSGSQRHGHDTHFSHWDFESLEKTLNERDFHSVERYDPRVLEPHNYVDDYSSAVLPYRYLYNADRSLSDAKMMSLNVRAWK